MQETSCDTLIHHRLAVGMNQFHVRDCLRAMAPLRHPSRKDRSVLSLCSLSQGPLITVQVQAEHTHAVVDPGTLFQVADIGCGNQRK